jgi:DNA-binding NtrC family response regulator
MFEHKTKFRILVVDDDQDLLFLLKKVIARGCDCEVALALSGADALKQVKNWHPDVVITDIMMPDMDGLQLLEQIMVLDSQMTIIMMTGYGTVEIAVKALKMGAYDFFEKPFNNTDLIQVLNRAHERAKLLKENQQLHHRLLKTDEQSEFIGKSRPLRQTIDVLSRLAQSNATVLIRGKSGTGKEVAARTLHRLSKRGKKPMITVNCPALPEQLLESELFGYCKGAFTGADADKDGLFMAAKDSTILLDEIADIPLSVQTKLLRVLQEKEIQPLGQTKTAQVDVRVLASTNQDLEAKMAKGEFREDLFFRLNVMTVTMPSLDEIREDIPLLALYFLQKFSKEHQRQNMEFSPEGLQYLLQRQWKGNIRELQNVISRAVLLAPEQILTPVELSGSANTGEIPVFSDQTNPLTELPYKEAKEQILSQFAVSFLTEKLKNSKGNVSAAAGISGMERQAFQRLMRRYNIQSQSFREE